MVLERKVDMADGQSFGGKAKKVVGYILAIIGGYMALISAAVPFLALIEGETGDFAMLVLTCVIMLAVNVGIFKLGVSLAAGAKLSFKPAAKSAPPVSPAQSVSTPPRASSVTPATVSTPVPVPTKPEVPGTAAYPELMTGQLVARFKQTHDQSYHDEYRRRLQFVGFEENEAESLFMFELMILKNDSIEPLASDDYLRSFIFDLQHVAVPHEKEYYVLHQTFLVSQIVKIWDEAEWHYWNSHERDLPDDVWEEIYTISRYGGGELFIKYLKMVAEKSHVPMSKVQKYSMAEQDMIFKYKWNVKANEKHPYER